jgi:hypothetical protein
VRVAFPGQDGRDDPHAGDAADVAEHFGELDIQLLQGLLHVLHMHGGQTDEQRALPPVRHARKFFVQPALDLLIAAQTTRNGPSVQSAAARIFMLQRSWP